MKHLNYGMLWYCSALFDEETALPSTYIGVLLTNSTVHTLLPFHPYLGQPESFNENVSYSLFYFITLLKPSAIFIEIKVAAIFNGFQNSIL